MAPTFFFPLWSNVLAKSPPKCVWVKTKQRTAGFSSFHVDPILPSPLPRLSRPSDRRLAPEQFPVWASKIIYFLKSRGYAGVGLCMYLGAMLDHAGYFFWSGQVLQEHRPAGRQGLGLHPVRRRGAAPRIDPSASGVHFFFCSSRHRKRVGKKNREDRPKWESGGLFK